MLGRNIMVTFHNLKEKYYSRKNFGIFVINYSKEK